MVSNFYQPWLATYYGSHKTISLIVENHTVYPTEVRKFENWGRNTIRISSFNYDHAWRQGLRSTDGNIRMVRGIDRFREHFRGYESSYALIGSWRTHKIFSCGLPSVTIHPRHRHEQTRSISDKKSLIPQSNNKISEQKIVRRNEINFKYNQ
jgi:hypothetical protein